MASSRTALFENSWRWSRRRSGLKLWIHLQSMRKPRTNLLLLSRRLRSACLTLWPLPKKKMIRNGKRKRKGRQLIRGNKAVCFRARACKRLPGRCDGSQFCSIQGTMNVMYCRYFSEDRRRSGQNGTRPFGLLSQMAPCCVARRSFGITKLLSSRLAWGHLGRQRSDLASVCRPCL